MDRSVRWPDVEAGFGRAIWRPSALRSIGRSQVTGLQLRRSLLKLFRFNVLASGGMLAWAESAARYEWYICAPRDLGCVRPATVEMTQCTHALL